MSIMTATALASHPHCTA